MKKRILSSIVLLFSLPVLANDAAILNATKSLNLTQVEIRPSTLPGFKLIFSTEGIFYISDNAKYVIEGDAYFLDNAGVHNLARESLTKKTAEIAQKSSIKYLSPKEKYKVTVFTDTTCNYCKKVHDELKNYANAGITIQYLAFPRQGINSAAGKQMQTIWCSDQKSQYTQLDLAFKKQKLPKTTCSNDVKIIEQFALGKQLGLRGTPTFVLPNGDILPGYISASQLLSKLEQISK